MSNNTSKTTTPVSRASSLSSLSSTPSDTPATNQPSTTHRIRLVPHLASLNVPSLSFEPIIRDAIEQGPAIRVGRFPDFPGGLSSAAKSVTALKIAFCSLVVSRGHADVWCESGGKVSTTSLYLYALSSS